MWFLTLAWAAVIFHFSTEGYGSSFSGWFLAKTLAFLHLAVSPYTFRTLNLLLRKSAHLTEYGILALLLYRTFLNRTHFEWRPHTAAWSVLVAGLYALTDELHQLFEPGRGPSLTDCGIDAAGALLGILAIYGTQFFPLSGRLRAVNQNHSSQAPNEIGSGT